MIILTKGQTAQHLIVTLNEKRTLTSGYYLFVFTHFTTGDVINKIYNFTEDNSSYPDRYNDFDINTQSLFGAAQLGQWKYEVYEQASSSNTDVTGLTMVEKGVMTLKPVTEYAPEEYNEPTTIKQYAG